MPLQSVSVNLLRPTQIAVGGRLVRQKRKDLRGLAKKPQELVDYILIHPISVVIGPAHAAYIIDHHHLGLALLQERFKTAPVLVEADLSDHGPAAFWAEMRRKAWVYPFDRRGKERPISDIPQDLEAMQDDPYRSLAGFVRQKGGFTKTRKPYAEFRWADYFRPLISPNQVSQKFRQSVKRGIELAAHPNAAHLPGYNPADHRAE